MTVAELPDDILAALRAHAAVSYPSECCGVIFKRGPAYEFMACRNVDPEPAHGFRVGSVDMEVIADLVRGGARLVAIYHSHIDMPATFSERDKLFARAWPRTIHLVFAVTDQGVIAQHAYDSRGACLDEPVMEPA